MCDHEDYMRLALIEAVKDLNEVPVGAVVVRNGEIIAAAHNQRESGDPFAHAEILAMKTAAEKLGDRRLKDCVMYVTLEPCPMCAGAMVMAQLGKCVFGAYDERQGCCGSVYMLPEDPAFFHRTQCIGGVLEKDCAALLQSFFEKKR